MPLDITPADLAILTQIPFLAIFVAFGVGVTQMVKDEFALHSKLAVRLLAAALIVLPALALTAIPALWKPYYMLFILALGVPGVIGLWKEENDKKAGIVITNDPAPPCDE